MRQTAPSRTRGWETRPDAAVPYLLTESWLLKVFYAISQTKAVSMASWKFGASRCRYLCNIWDKQPRAGPGVERIGRMPPPLAQLVDTWPIGARLVCRELRPVSLEERTLVIEHVGCAWWMPSACNTLLRPYSQLDGRPCGPVYGKSASSRQALGITFAFFVSFFCWYQSCSHSPFHHLYFFIPRRITLACASISRCISNICELEGHSFFLFLLFPCWAPWRAESMWDEFSVHIHYGES